MANAKHLENVAKLFGPSNRAAQSALFDISREFRCAYLLLLRLADDLGTETDLDTLEIDFINIL